MSDRRKLIEQAEEFLARPRVSVGAEDVLIRRLVDALEAGERDDDSDVLRTRYAEFLEDRDD